jgi:tubulysin polyketide synthase-like protein
MNITALLSDLASRHIQVISIGNKLVARPKARLTDADREAIRQHKVELLALLTCAEQIEEADIDRLARGDGWQPNPAESIVATCQRYSVALRIDPTGDLVVGKTGANADQPTQSWPSLLIAIEAHLEAVAALVASGWNLRAEFPERGAA